MKIIKRPTKLEKAIAGREVLAYVDGKYNLRHRKTNLYKEIIALGYTPNDVGKTIDIAVGAQVGTGKGYRMAIVKIGNGETKK